MSQTPENTQGVVPKTGQTRREFLTNTLNALKFAGATAFVLSLPGDTPQQSRVEAEPSVSSNPLIIDFPPSPEALKYVKDNGETNLVTGETPLFDLDSFLQKHIGMSYSEIKKTYGAEVQYPMDEYNELAKILLQHGQEKEALSMLLAQTWSYHGVSVARHMRAVREGTNDKDFKPNDPNSLPIEPYSFLPLQNYITNITKSPETDAYGNSYYDITIDHKALAEAIKKSPQKIINASFNVGTMRIRVGRHLPKNQLEHSEEGWSSIYAGSGRKVNGEMVDYEIPPIAIETAYSNPRSLEALQEFAKTLTEEGKIVVLASGNSQTTLPQNFRLPRGAFLVSAWNSETERPQHNFIGEPGSVYYIDPTNYANEMGHVSSAATAQVSEWLSENHVTNQQTAQYLLNKNSRINTQTNAQILGFGAVPDRDIWNNSQMYRPVN